MDATHQIALKRIGDLCEEAINRAKENHSEFSDPKIWGDLHCIQTEYWEHGDGDHGYRAFIRESFPPCTEFHTYIENYVFEKSGLHVSVTTEW